VGSRIASAVVDSGQGFCAMADFLCGNSRWWRLTSFMLAVLGACASSIAIAESAAKEEHKAADGGKSADMKGGPRELYGRVVDADGMPLSGVTVDVWTWYPGNETKTDTQGAFRLKGFEPNEQLEVEFRKDSYGPRHFVNQRAGTADWVVVMDNRTYLEGNVVDAKGEPAADVSVRAERGPFKNTGMVIDEVATTTRTDHDGNYRLYLEPDSYSIKIRSPGHGVARIEKETIAAGEQRLYNMSLEAGVTFRARVVDSVSGKPVEGIVLWNWRLPGIEGTSNAEGMLEISAMYPGKFEFSVGGVGDNRQQSSVAGNYARWWSQEATQEHQRKEANDGSGFQRNFDSLEFNLGPSDPIVTIYVEPCVTITGQVLDPDGKPVKGATVAPAKTGSGNSLTGDTRFSYTTKKDGTFEMKLPASGAAEYNLVAHDGKYEEWRKWANGTGEPFRTKPGDRKENVTLRLTRPGTIRGHVSTSVGFPAAGKDVRAADAQRRDNRYYHPTTKTDANGDFELKFVGPGKQYIQAEPYWLDPAQAPKGTSAVVELKEGATVEGVEIRSGS
jgi:protocatechuate 3,4-dioxygenase beta subunit